MSTLKKNKRIKRASLVELYGDLKPGRGNKKTERGKAKYLGGNGRKTTGISKRVYRRNLKRIQVIENGARGVSSRSGSPDPFRCNHQTAGSGPVCSAGTQLISLHGVRLHAPSVI